MSHVYLALALLVICYIAHTDRIGLYLHLYVWDFWWRISMDGHPNAYRFSHWIWNSVSGALGHWLCGIRRQVICRFAICYM